MTKILSRSPNNNFKFKFMTESYHGNHIGLNFYLDERKKNLWQKFLETLMMLQDK